MNFLCLTIVSTVSTAMFAVENLPPAWTPRIVSYFHSSGNTLKGPDRTITWGAWKKVPGAEFSNCHRVPKAGVCNFTDIVRSRFPPAAKFISEDTLASCLVKRVQLHI